MDLEVGGIYTGKVTGITKFGVFVSFEGGKSGLVHISEISNSFVSDINEHVKAGQSVRVKLLSFTNEGKINLSIKQVEGAAQEKKNEAPPRIELPVKHEKYVMAPVQTVRESSGDMNFEDRLKKFMQDADSRIADSRIYSDRRQKSRRRQ